MANKRTQKRAINAISDELLVECVAASLYGPENHRDDADALLGSIFRMQADFTRRVSHPEPGLTPSSYYKDLREKFTAQVSDIVDQINNL